MSLPNTKFKIVYSLRVHLGLQELGFKALNVMPNPQNPNFNCWTYADTPEFKKAFSSLVKEE